MRGAHRTGAGVALQERRRELVDRWIEPNPHYSGPQEARLVDSGVSVWVLIAHHRLVDGDVARVAEDYAVPREAVEAALAYYDRYRYLIDARIALNNAAFTE